MNIPVLPKSNLYRFKSIVGLVLICLSICLNFYLMVDYNQQSIRINAVIESLKTEIESSLTQLDDIKNKVIPLCKLNNCRCVDEKGVLIEPVFEKGPPLITKKQKEMDELFRTYTHIESNVKQHELHIKQKEMLIADYAKFVYPYFFALVVILFVGLFFFLSGLRDWKNKIQRHQDILLRKHVKNYQSDT